MCWEFRKGGPTEYKSYRGNELTCVPNDISQSILYLDLSENKIKDMENIPPVIKWLDVSYNPILEIQNLNQCDQLERLEMDHCLLKKIGKKSLPPNLRSLSLYGNDALERMGNYPPALVQLHLGSKKISRFESFPPCLQYFHYDSCGGEKINKIENLPPSLVELSIGWQGIAKIENLPPNLKRLSLFQNEIRVLENVPDSVEFLELSGNPLESIRHIPRQCKHLLLSGQWNLNEKQVSKLRNHKEKWAALLELIRSVNHLDFKQKIEEFFRPLHVES